MVGAVAWENAVSANVAMPPGGRYITPINAIFAVLLLTEHPLMRREPSIVKAPALTTALVIEKVESAIDATAATFTTITPALFLALLLQTEHPVIRREPSTNIAPTELDAETSVREQLLRKASPPTRMWIEPAAPWQSQAYPSLAREHSGK